MKKAGLILLWSVCSLLAAISILWLVLFTVSLLFSGGQYSYTDENGYIHHTFLFFNKGWLWILFNAFVVPIVIAAASILTIRVCRKNFY